MPLRGRQGVQVEYPVVSTLELRPTAGMWTSDPGEEAPLGSSPDMLNFCVFQGVLRKRPGTLQYWNGNAALPSAVMGLYSTLDEENNGFLYAATLAGIYRFDVATHDWIAVTGAALTGSTLDYFSFQTSQNRVVFSQGVDAVQVIEMGVDTYAALAAGAVPTRYLERFADRLLLGVTIESAVTKPFRVRWPVNGDHTTWTGTGSGFRDASEFPYYLQGIRKLGSVLAIYYERAIELATRTEALPPIRFDLRAADIGLYAPRTLCGRNDMHAFLGNDDIYEFSGVTPTGIAAQVRDTIFGTLNATQLHRMFAALTFDSQEYWFFLCSGAAVYPDQIWAHNWRSRIWYPWSVTNPTCAVTHRLDDATTINGLVGTIDEQNWEFDSRQLQQAFPAMLTGHSDGKVRRWSLQYMSDDGTAIACRWTSRDLLAEQIDPALRGKQVTLRRIATKFYYDGNASGISYYVSGDGGASWLGPYTGQLDSRWPGSGSIPGWATEHCDVVITGNAVRFKIEHSSATQGVQISSFVVELEVRGMSLT